MQVIRFVCWKHVRRDGCVQGGLRVTEQGEMVHSKFGTPEIAKVCADDDHYYHMLKDDMI